MPFRAGQSFLKCGTQEGLGNRRGQNIFGENRLVPAVELYWKDGEYTGCGTGSLGIKSAAAQQWLKA